MASKVAKHAHKNELTLRASAIQLEALSEGDFDRLVRPELMISPSNVSEMPSSQTTDLRRMSLSNTGRELS